MSDFDQQEEQGFFAANKVWLTLGLVALVLGGVGIWKMSKGGASGPVRQERLTMVSLPPPPPPPPRPTPPPVQQPPPDQKVVEKKEMVDESPKPDAAKPEPPKAPDEPPPSMGSNIKGSGSDGFGLSGSGNGGFVGIGGKGTGGGSAYGRYASQVKTRIAEALRQDKRTRAAAFEVKVKLWIDGTGKVTRAEPAGGNDSAGAAATLVGMRLADRPPDGMPMPLIAQLSARRP